MLTVKKLKGGKVEKGRHSITIAIAQTIAIAIAIASTIVH